MKRSIPVLQRSLACLALPALLLACAGAGDDDASAWPSAPLEIEFRLADSEPAQNTTPMPLFGEGELVHVEAAALLTGADIATANAFPIPEGVMLELSLNEAGRTRLASATAANPGRLMAVLIDSVAVTASRFVQPMTADLTRNIPLHVPLRLPPVQAERLVAAVDATW